MTSWIHGEDQSGEPVLDLAAYKKAGAKASVGLTTVIYADSGIQKKDDVYHLDYISMKIIVFNTTSI